MNGKQRLRLPSGEINEHGIVRETCLHECGEKRLRLPSGDVNEPRFVHETCPYECRGLPSGDLRPNPTGQIF